MATDLQKAQEDYELFEYCRVQGGHNDFLQHSETAQRYYASRQWLHGDITKRTAEGRLSFTVNEIFRTMNAVRGELFNLSTDVRYDPGPGGSQEVASILNKLSEHIDRSNRSFYVDDQVRLAGLLTGRGFWEMRVDFDDNLQGNIIRKFKRSQNVVLDADLDSPNPNDWSQVFTTEVVSLDDIESLYGRRYGEKLKGWPQASFLSLDDRNLAQSIGSTTPFRDGGFDPSKTALKQYRMISRQYREYKYKDFFVDLVTGDMEEIPENWSDEKIKYVLDNYELGTIRRKAKTVRWRVTCNDIVLHDEDSPYRHFTIVPYFPFYLDGHTASLFDALKGPQDMLNYTVNEELQILGTTSHSGWKVRQGSLKNMTTRELEIKGAKNGLVMELEDIKDAERITPGQPASGFERLGDRSRSWIMDLANVTPSMLGSQGQYAPGKGMDTQLSRAPVNLSAPLTAYQFSMSIMAEIKLDLIQTFYTEERTFQMASGAFNQTEEVTINKRQATGEIANNLALGSYQYRVLPATSRTAADEFAFDELLELKQLGITVPNSLFVQASSLQAKPDMMDVLIEANNGEISPEEQRARELELRGAEADVMDTEASAQQKLAAADLNRARAQKNIADASYDARADSNQINRDRLLLEDRRQNRQLDLQDRKMATDAGIKLTAIAQKGAQEQRKSAENKAAPTKQPRRGNNSAQR